MRYTTRKAYEDYKRFIDIWMEAYHFEENQSWVANALKVSRQAVSSRAAYLRDKGVELPRLARSNVVSGSMKSDLNDHIMKKYAQPISKKRLDKTIDNG